MFSVKPATPRTARATRMVASLAMATLALGLTTACSRTSPTQTTEFYQAGDGAVVNLGAVADGRNLLVLADKELTVAQIDGVFVNNSDKEQSITFKGQDGEFDATVAVPAGKSVRVGPDQKTQIKVEVSKVKLGAVVQSTISLSGGASQKVAVPVLDDTQDEYKEPVKVMKAEAGK